MSPVVTNRALAALVLASVLLLLAGLYLAARVTL